MAEGMMRKIQAVLYMGREARADVLIRSAWPLGELLIAATAVDYVS
jgi:hypothetical protein